MMLFTWAFPCVGLPRMGGFASCSSGSLASRFELLVSLQGASDSMPHFSPESVVVISGFWHSGMGVAPGNVPSS